MPSKATPPPIPLPDPEIVEARVVAALRTIRERKGLFAGIAAAIVVAVIGLLVVLNLGKSQGSPEFARLAERYDAVKRELARNLSAREPIAFLDAHIAKIRGTREEGLGLWYGALAHYREAWVGDKQTFEDRRPHLEQAVAYLKELRGERFDAMLLAKSKWFTATGQPPIEQMLRQVEADLAWARSNSVTVPAPASDPVAVIRTELGDIHLRFYPELAPRHTETFLSLAVAGAYNGTAFHFVKGGTEAPEGVMGGDPYSFFYNDPLLKAHILRWGTGGTGVGIPPEQARLSVNHVRGVVTSQRTDKADWDNGIQFQIVTATERSLDRIHTPFAMVVEGMDVVDRIARRKTAASHPIFRDDSAFQSVHARDLLVEPVVIHKVLVYDGSKAREHAFTLEEGEKSLDTLAATPARALPEDQIHGGRRMMRASEGTAPRPGLDFPFPHDVDPEKADPLGERRGSTAKPPGEGGGGPGDGKPTDPGSGSGCGCGKTDEPD